jgi:predicted molibdopterin-dependent oxidoreductase YjgC
MRKEGDAFREASWADAIRDVAASLKNCLAVHGPQGAALLVSPQMTNEELFFIRRLFKDQLKIENIESRVPSYDKVHSDDFLITADKNPNTRGVDLLCPGGPGSEALLRACADGRIHFLYIFQHDWTRGYEEPYVREALRRVDRIVFQGSWEHPTADLADIRLPAAVYAEKDGTFTNVQGRVQRFHAAVPPMGESLPDLDILSKLASELRLPAKASSPEQVFSEIGQAVEAFAGMTWQTVGSNGQLLNPESGK